MAAATAAPAPLATSPLPSTSLAIASADLVRWPAALTQRPHVCARDKNWAVVGAVPQEVDGIVGVMPCLQAVQTPVPLSVGQDPAGVARAVLLEQWRVDDHARAVLPCPCSALDAPIIENDNVALQGDYEELDLW